MTWFLLWVFVSIEKIAAFLTVGSVIFKWSVVIFIACYILSFIMSKDHDGLVQMNQRLKWWRRIFVMTAIMGLGMSTASQLMPTKKELAMIIGGGVTWEVLTSETSKEMGGKVIQLLNNELDNALKGSAPQSQKTTSELIDDVSSNVNGSAKELVDSGTQVVSKAIDDNADKVIEASKTLAKETITTAIDDVVNK